MRCERPTVNDARCTVQSAGCGVRGALCATAMTAVCATAMARGALRRGTLFSVSSAVVAPRPGVLSRNAEKASTASSSS